jgi:transcriptional regulator with GAF, ATPase, and Fis domain
MASGGDSVIIDPIVARAEAPPGATEALVRDDGRLRLRTHKLQVEIVDGPDAGLILVTSGPRARIGSDPAVELRLADPSVSRHHATLELRDGEVVVTDAGSRNGTVVDGMRVERAFARPDSAIALGRTTLRLRLVSDVVDLPPSARDHFGALLGTSLPMRQLFAVLERVAPTDTTVLVEGETGTGKELCAEALHEHSRRAGRPFVVFDCSSVASSLIESQLFGHVRGAFTGAVADRVGALEAADGGTLFLDEIGELPLELQPKLLRAIERLEVRPVGSHEVRRVDVRIVAATNRSLRGEVDRGAFREDLYYRLAVVRVVPPPLRERPGDVPLLVEHFTRQFEARHGAVGSLPADTVAAFARMAWPGNVRELRNAVVRALSLGPPRALDAAGGPAAPLVVDLSIPFKDARDQLVEAFERAYITRALEVAAGNVSRAAELAGVNRKLIHRAIARHGLRSDGDDDGTDEPGGDEGPAR